MQSNDLTASVGQEAFAGQQAFDQDQTRVVLQPSARGLTFEIAGSGLTPILVGTLHRKPEEKQTGSSMSIFAQAKVPAVDSGYAITQSVMRLWLGV